jgi:hypothetical protein
MSLLMSVGRARAGRSRFRLSSGGPDAHRLIRALASSIAWLGVEVWGLGHV